MKEILITSPSTHIDPWEIMSSVDEWNLTKNSNSNYTKITTLHGEKL